MRSHEASLAAAIGGPGQAALKQSNLSDRDLADGLREQELLEAGLFTVGDPQSLEDQSG